MPITVRGNDPMLAKALGRNLRSIARLSLPRYYLTASRASKGSLEDTATNLSWPVHNLDYHKVGAYPHLLNRSSQENSCTMIHMSQCSCSSQLKLSSRLNLPRYLSCNTQSWNCGHSYLYTDEARYFASIFNPVAKNSAGLPDRQMTRYSTFDDLICLHNGN